MPIVGNGTPTPGGGRYEPPRSVLELSDLGWTPSADRSPALMEISRRGTAGHIARWALMLAVSVFVVDMNTATALNRPPAQITNTWHTRLLAFHPNVGLIYFALMRRCRFGWISDARAEAPLAK